jgi:hypothetical protein
MYRSDGLPVKKKTVDISGFAQDPQRDKEIVPPSVSAGYQFRNFFFTMVT